VLPEIAGEWAGKVALWSSLLRRDQGARTGEAFDANDEYLFYQMLLGAWPADLAWPAEGNGTAALDQLRIRIEGAMLKAVREAKTHTAWTAVNPAYETAMLRFVRHALDSAGSKAFLDSFAGFAARVARLGMLNSLVQTVLKLTVPGVPDIYQGAELWDFNMVDPDNRRPVDFSTRQALFADIADKSAADLLSTWQDGAIKLWLTAKLLALRRARPHLFERGAYRPLAVTGPDAARICAFERRHGGEVVVVAVSRFPARDLARPGFAGTALSLPAVGTWTSLFGGMEIDGALDTLAAADLFRELPVAVLSGAAPSA